ncbi:MAG: hypothetical protein EOR71_19895 [Mesorhizobium sp.]|nr:MAG: hypothetical protein EOR71_19895 [Mesorhizobium sp.]
MSGQEIGHAAGDLFPARLLLQPVGVTIADAEFEIEAEYAEVIGQSALEGLKRHLKAILDHDPRSL